MSSKVSHSSLLFSSILCFLLCAAIFFSGSARKNSSDSNSNLFPSAQAGFGEESIWFFQNYHLWPSSPNLKTDDNMGQALYFLYESNDKGSLADFNGDGLVDILAHGQFEYAIFLNTGTEYELYYKCKYDVNNRIYYGDCADV